MTLQLLTTKLLSTTNVSSLKDTRIEIVYARRAFLYKRLIRSSDEHAKKDKSGTKSNSTEDLKFRKVWKNIAKVIFSYYLYRKKMICNAIKVVE